MDIAIFIIAGIGCLIFGWKVLELIEEMFRLWVKRMEDDFNKEDDNHK